MLTVAQHQTLLDLLRQALPSLQAVYLFGSQASGQAQQDSDIDLAILLPSPADAEALWHLGDELAGMLGRDVDLVDLRNASTVMQHQVINHGTRLWQRDQAADEFEVTSLSQYWDLQIMRSGILSDIRQRGRVYDR
ncbi:nucleotidyltransferase domain-containing protein [Halomonas sp. ML-15]|uniref:type VII toxin-antitoxin system MntA family adenylyltransferase antitoxin n=1 Tax=Halomonas sp. ML-15 TaxID=2773305 RepID=UPI00174789B3|nr:nucleotidyltransferase domain-containing protein [Halomonas sp. ML-15]MBD3897954.1 nucleotidyltransferase domain-containing protein [Halomonas sp. ML-15]